MSDQESPYDSAQIRELLLEGFGCADLEHLCRDNDALKPITRQFTDLDTLAHRVDLVVDYCDKQMLFPTLLARVKLANPARYAQFEKQQSRAAAPAAFAAPRKWMVIAPVAAVVVIALIVVAILKAGSPARPGAADMTVTPLGGAQVPAGLEPSTPPARVTCSVPAAAEFAGAYGSVQAALGCPISLVSTNMAWQPFENGQMLWRDSTDEDKKKVIYVLHETGVEKGEWEMYADSWGTPQPPYSCQAAEDNPYGPKNGFGKVWCNGPDVRRKLDKATDYEQGVRGTIQVMDNGLMIKLTTGETFILYNTPSKAWEKR